MNYDNENIRRIERNYDLANSIIVDSDGVEFTENELVVAKAVFRQSEKFVKTIRAIRRIREECGINQPSLESIVEYVYSEDIE